MRTVRERYCPEPDSLNARFRPVPNDVPKPEDDIIGIGIRDSRDGDGDAILLLYTDDKVAAERVGESGNILEDLLLVRVGVPVDVALIINAKSFGNLQRNEFFDVAFIDIVEVETFN